MHMQMTRAVFVAETLALILAAPLCVQAEDKSHVTSEQVTRAIQEIEKLAQGQIQENALPGLAIAVVFQDKVVYAKGFGVRDATTKLPVDADTVFQLASLSKPIGSTVVADLVGEGKITWESKLSVLDPTFEMFDPWVTREITIRDMYAHRSGLPAHAGDLLEDLDFTRAEILHRLRYQHPGSSFRSHYAYTNFGMTEAGIAAAKAYGLEWDVSYDPEGRLRLNLSGAFALGAATYANLVPAEQLGIVVLTNAYPLGIAEALGTTFMDTALYGKPTQDWFALFKQVYSNPAAIGTELGFDYSKPPASSAPALKNSAYFGRYTNDYFGGISIIEKDDGLAILQGPKNKTFPMKHYDRDTFTYETEGENAVGRSGITFTIGPDGKATQVLVENLNVRGEGIF